MFRHHITDATDPTGVGGSAAPATGTGCQDRPHVRVLAVIGSDGSRFKLVGALTPNQLRP